MRTLDTLGSIIPSTLIASAILGLLTLTGMYLLPENQNQVPTLELTTDNFNSVVGEEFTVKIVVDSNIPVNAFKGLITFNENVLVVTKIDYNTSLADLWAVTPWYKNGAGTIEFAGGTTKVGGFTGTDNLLLVTFLSLAPGNGDLTLTDTQVLQHDGYGTDTILADYIDTIFTISSSTTERIIPHDTKTVANVKVLDDSANPDLNDDGKVNLKDVSVFFIYLSKGDLRGDLNGDNKLSTIDLSIILKNE